jgi:hypothetical protein
MLTRRETVLGGALTIVFSGASVCACATRAGAPNSRGCRLAKADLDAIFPAGTETRTYVTGDEQIILNSGDRYFDLALAQTLAKLYGVFGVLPGFAYYNDVDAQNANAFATTEQRLNRTDGTVLMGINMLKSLRTSGESPEAAVVAVCAHEFGHILQFRDDLDLQVDLGQPNVRRSELQADYFVGYFVGLRKREKPTFPAAVAALTQYSFGSTDAKSPDYHGSQKERGEAVVRGFQASFFNRKNLNDAITESTAYVMSL